ncbi:MAG TPA: type II toxin-antitoxin system RelE/ParE family toxin [Rhodothermales bacterium]|nr:type II toxin-antitoxin system RelE/ParE family toxin [Rhodothermales bacterium]
MRVHWTNTALDHLIAIHEFAAQNSIIYADRLVDRLTRRSEQIAVFPKSGRIVPEWRREDVREIIEPPYRIVYRLLEGRIDVLAVLHTAQDVPPQS